MYPWLMEMSIYMIIGIFSELISCFKRTLLLLMVYLSLVTVTKDCFFKSTKSNSLEDHLKSEHGIKCAKCEFRFKNVSRLQNHVKLAHSCKKSVSKLINNQCLLFICRKLVQVIQTCKKRVSLHEREISLRNLHGFHPK